MKSVTKPDLRTYLNVHQYLEDLYKFRKQTENDFSYETWSQELDIANRSFLRQIVIGKRALTDTTTKLLCERMGFDEVEQEYFKLLVLYSKSRSKEQRNLFGRKLMQLIKSDYEQNEILNYYEFLSDPLLPRLQTLLSFRDISKDAQSLQQMMSVSREKIEAALDTLERSKLAEKNESGEWKSLKRAFHVPDNIGDAALLDYHSQALNDAIEAKALPKDQRRYKSLLVPLSPEEFQEFLVDVQEFSKKCLMKFDTDDLKGRRLHQININVHAVTELPERIEELLSAP